MIKRNFKDSETFLVLYKHFVRSHLEYCNWAPCKKSHIDKLERVQKRATKMIPEFKKTHYPLGQTKLNLPTLTYRSRGDMIETMI